MSHQVYLCVYIFFYLSGKAWTNVSSNPPPPQPPEMWALYMAGMQKKNPFFFFHTEKTTDPSMGKPYIVPLKLHVLQLKKILQFFFFFFFFRRGAQELNFTQAPPSSSLPKCAKPSVSQCFFFFFFLEGDPACVYPRRNLSLPCI